MLQDFNLYIYIKSLISNWRDKVGKWEGRHIDPSHILHFQCASESV